MKKTDINKKKHDFSAAHNGQTIYYKITSFSYPLTVEVIYGGEYPSASYSWDVVIPDRVTYNGNTYAVTAIRNYAFAYCRDLTSVTIPHSVTAIGNNSFAHCSRLTSITIPDSVIFIGDDAFHGCSRLTSVTIPDSIVAMGNRVFEACSGLTSLTIPDSVRTMESSLFLNRSDETKETLNEELQYIPEEPEEPAEKSSGYGNIGALIGLFWLSKYWSWLAVIGCIMAIYYLFSSKYNLLTRIIAFILLSIYIAGYFLLNQNRNAPFNF
ncbi:MAG: leucine-rich repeat domain-containing protein [Bacteroidales bacterium]|jgi:hypothetical protein|nr:leucine-rich repeat domain-containing protein [Bacteroidales bacterium]